MKITREGHALIDKKIAMMRLSGKDLREALIQKYKKSISEKILSIFNQQFGQINSMQFPHYNECLQANFLQQVNVTKDWLVPRYFKLYF